MVHFTLPSARHWLFVVAILALSGIVPAAAGPQALGAPYMVRAWGTREYLGYPLELTAIGETLFFSAADSRGSELWKSDGTSSGSVIVKDIQPGSDDSAPKNLVNVNGTLFFSANQNGIGRTLWKSDGTEAGTVMVKDLEPFYDTQPSFSEMTNVNGLLFFLIGGSQLWRSDGTEAGTQLLLSNSTAGFLTNLDGLLVFANYDPEHGSELWRSDGTVAGTTMIMDLNPGPGLGVCYQTPLLTNVDGTLFFAGNDSIHGCELWQSDGTAAGTQRLTDINPGAASAYDPLTSSIREHIIALGSQLFFYADDGVHGRELWTYDRTSGDAQLMKDIFPGSETSFGFYLTVLNGTLLFIARDSATNDELWRSDGTPSGTTKVKEINPGSGFQEITGPMISLPQEHVALFGANNGSNGTEVWKTDGTAAGTMQVANIAPGSMSSLPYYFTAVSKHIFFTADDGSDLGRQLWAMSTNPLPPEPTVTITDTSTAAVNERITFTASIQGNIEASTPISYTWRASGLQTAHQTNGASDAATFSWAEGGTQFVTVSARQGEHLLGGVTVAVQVQGPTPALTITGPTTGDVMQPIPFTVQLNSASMPFPISYQWAATDQPAVTHSGTFSDTRTFAWNTAGQKTITVAASKNGVPIATVSHTITVQSANPSGDPSSTQRKVFLPVLVK